MGPGLPDHDVLGAGEVTIFLLNGVYGSRRMWRFLARRCIDRGYRVVPWDAPGYGGTPLPGDFGFERVAEDGARLLDATGSDRNILFGQSMGAQIIPRIRLKRPHRVQGLVICSTMGYFGNRTPEEQAAFVRERAGEALARDPHAANKAMIDSMRAGGEANEEVAYVREVAAITPAATVKAAVEAIRSYPAAEAIAAYRAIDVPTLLVAGAEDHGAGPATMRRIADLIPGSEFISVPSSGHYPWAENPAGFDAPFFDFLTRHFHGAPT